MARSITIVSIVLPVLLSCLPLVIQANPANDPPGAKQDVTLLGRLATGPCKDVAIAGTTAYYINGGGIEIVDITSVEQPVPLGQVLVSSMPKAIAVQDDYIYVACCRDGLRIIDARDPANAIEVGYFDTPGWAENVFVSGQIAYVTDGIMGLRVIDVSDPANPQPRGSYTSTYFSAMVSVFVDGNIAYISSTDTTTENETMVHIVDVSDPDHPSRIGYFYTGGDPGNLVVQGDLIYYMCGDGLEVYNISDPRNPVRSVICNTIGHQGFGIAVAGDLVFVTELSHGLRVISLENPAAPQEIGGLETKGVARDLVLYGSHVLIADEFMGLQIVDVEDPSNPVESTLLPTGSRTCGVDFAGDLALVGKEFDGLQIVDISDPAAPVPLGLCDLPDGTNRIDYQGTTAYVANYREGLQIVDFSDPNAPVKIGSWETEMMVCDVAAAGDYVYLTDYSHGLKVIDVTDPTGPVLVGHCSTPTRLYGLDVKDKYVFVTDYQTGLLIIDVSVPYAPVEVGRWTTPDLGIDVDVVGDYAYFVSHLGGVYVIDVHDPTAPFEVGYLGELGDRTFAVDVQDGYAFLSGGLPGALYIVDVNDPASPTLVSTYETGIYSLDVAISSAVPNKDDLTILLADDATGLWLFATDLVSTAVPATGLPTRLDLAQNFPNPFNPVTTIEFDLKQSSEVTLTVFDIAGHLVQVLVDGKTKAAGHHAVIWAGRDTQGRTMPSGTYFYRLDAGRYSETKRMVLAK